LRLTSAEKESLAAFIQTFSVNKYLSAEPKSAA
jgi:hypothetical protein